MGSETKSMTMFLVIFCLLNFVLNVYAISVVVALNDGNEKLKIFFVEELRNCNAKIRRFEQKKFVEGTFEAPNYLQKKNVAGNK